MGISGDDPYAPLPHSPQLDTVSLFLDNGRTSCILDICVLVACTLHTCTLHTCTLHTAMADETLTPSVRRTIEVLEGLLAHPQGLTLKQLLASVDGPRSSVFVVLNTLKSLGYVEQSERRGRYRAGARLLAWRASAPSVLNADLLKAFYEEAEAAQLPETLALAMALPTGEIQVVAQVEGGASVRSVFVAGQRLPGESAAHALLQPLVAAEIRTLRYAVAPRDEAVDVALPICRDGVLPSAALVLSTPAYRWSLAAYQPLLATVGELAARLSYRLGAPLYAPWRTDAEPELTQMTAMDEAQIAAVLAAPWMARLACVDRDGAPHVIPVWHEWDRKQRTFHILAWRGSRWAHYLLDNPQVSLTVDEPWPPLRRVSARGVAAPLYCRSEDGSDEPHLGRLLARLSRRYLGRNVAETLAPQVERSFIITPHTLRGWQGLPAAQERTP